MEANRIAAGAATSDSETSLDSEKAAGQFAAVQHAVITALSLSLSRAKVKSLETQRQKRCNAIKPFTVNQAHSRSTDLSMSLRISSVVMPSLPRAFTEIEKHTARLTQRLNYYDNT